MGPRAGSPGRTTATGRSGSSPTTVLRPQGEAVVRRHPTGMQNDHAGMVPRECDRVQVRVGRLAETPNRLYPTSVGLNLQSIGGHVSIDSLRSLL